MSALKRRGCGRRPRSSTTALPTRNSSRLANLDKGLFVDVTSKAVQRKALRKCLAACSPALQKHVTGRKILKHKNPLGALDLRRLAKAAGLSCADQSAIAAVSGAAPPP